MVIETDSKGKCFEFIEKIKKNPLYRELIIVLIASEKGEMSLVGNRPLPLYEAEMLTSNDWSHRFIGPAGVTGLWQIKSKGKRDVSERERKKFDNFYASKYSFWFDLINGINFQK